MVDYVRRLEEAMIRAFADLGLATGRVAGRSGVWLEADPRQAQDDGLGPGRPERKIAAIGVRVAAGVTMHGFAINVDPDLGWFDKIVPCGITDAGVTSLAAELDDSTLSLPPWRTCCAPTSRTCSASPRTRSRRTCTPSLRPTVSYGITV